MNSVHRGAVGSSSSTWGQTERRPAAGGGRSLARTGRSADPRRTSASQVIKPRPGSWASFSLDSNKGLPSGFRGGIRPADLTLGILPPPEQRLKADQVMKLCQDEWRSRYLVLTAQELVLTLPGSEQISDKIPLVSAPKWNGTLTT